MRKILVLTGVLIGLYTSAQTSRYPVSAIAISSASYRPGQSNLFSGVSNPALLSFNKRAGAGMYAEKKYGTESLVHLALSGILPVKGGSLGANLQYTGAGAYSETGAGLAYARILGKASVGLLFNYQLFRTEGFHSRGYLSYVVGATYQLAPQVTAGFSITNPSILTIKAEGAPAQAFRMGFGYDVSSQLYLGFEWHKEDNRNIQLIPSLRYRPDHKYQIRAALATATSECYIGMGWLTKALYIELSLTVHMELGPGPGALVIFHAQSEGND